MLRLTAASLEARAFLQPVFAAGSARSDGSCHHGAGTGLGEGDVYPYRLLPAGFHPASAAIGARGVGIVVIAAAGAGVVYWRHWWPFTPAPQAAAAPPPVPVQTAKVVQQPVPIWVTGLGAVQAYNTVTIRARVDGQLVHVAYHEG